MRFILATCGIAVMGCSQKHSAPSHPLVTLTVALAVDPRGLDPAEVSDFESVDVTSQIFERLVRYRTGSTEVEPALATRWEISQDGTRWTFHLRRDVHFHDGTPMDADAVVFSFERQRDPNHPFHFGRYAYWDSTFLNIQRVQKIDAMTVQLVIDRPFAPFLANLAMFSVGIVSPTAVKKYGREFAHRPVGTGPFRFVEWVAGDRVVLEANPHSWQGASSVGHLVFRTVRDARARLVGLEGGAIDIAQSLDPSDLQFVPMHPDLVLHRAAGANIAYLAMNTEHPPFDDVRVRQAINHAVNRDAIVKLVYQGMARIATGPLPPTIWGYRRSQGYAYDPAKARALLKQVRPHAERPSRLLVMDTPRPYLQNPEQVARIIERNLEDVGFPIDVAVLEWDEFRRRIFAGEHDLCLSGWVGDNGDPDNFLYVLLDSESAIFPKVHNLAFYKNAALDGLLVRARESHDRAERERLYVQAQERIEQDAPWVPLAHAEAIVAARKAVHGVVLNFDGTVDYWRVQKIQE